MLGDKQEQSADAGATAIQAGRDVHYHGLSVSEVKELCTLFLINNFPELREEARRTAEEHVRIFAQTLEQKLVNDATSIVLEKFSEPDVQAAINDAVQASARKGQAANPTILSTLISERVAKITNNYKDIVISEAVQVVPRLTHDQIALLSFIHFVFSVTVGGLQRPSSLEQYGQVALRFSSPGFGLSNSQKRHIEYTGAASFNNLLGGNIYDVLVKKGGYDYFGFTDGATFKAVLATQAPSFSKLLDQFNLDNLFTMQLTSVGQAIAIANISNHFESNHIKGLDYTIWLY